MADIFISYKREDRAVAERLAHALGQLGFEVWWDLDLLAGDKYRKVIREVIDQCKAAVVLWSARSVDSDFVMDEAGHAKARGKLCPARIESLDLPFGFGQIQTDDLTGWDGELTHAGFQGLVRSLEVRVGRKARLGEARPSAAAQALNAELQAFQAAELAGSPAALRAFLQQHPGGAFSAFVRGQIDSLEPSAAPVQAARAAAAAPVADPQPAPRAPSPPDPAPTRSRRWIPVLAVGAVAVAAAVVGIVRFEAAQDEAREAQAELQLRQSALEEERRAREAAEAKARDAEASARVALQKAQEQRQAIEREQQDRARAEAEAQRRASALAEQQRLAREKAAAEAGAAAANEPPPRGFKPHDSAQLHPDVRAAVNRARAATGRANDNAARARSAADKARAGGAVRPNAGLGIETDASTGSQYAGEFANGRAHGLGVYTYGKRAGTTDAGLVYYGEFVDGKRTGVGLYSWPDGALYGGDVVDGQITGFGVFMFADEHRSEGSFRNGKYAGHVVEWDAQGRMLRAGIYSDGNLTTALGAQPR